MKVFIVLGLVALASALPFEGEQVHEWNLFKVQHGKSYSGHEEESLRAKIYLDNKQKVEAHNALYDQGLVSYKLKMNKFSDMLTSEVKQKMNGYSGHKRSMLGNSKFDSSKVGQVADAIDWRQKGAVTPVKNQAQCGSCWAFSTTGSLEGQHFLKTGKLVSLSEQQLVDCSGDYGNMGCNGGLMDQAFQYIKDNGGIDTEESYGYTATDGKCKFNKKNVGATDSGFVDIPSGDEEALKKAIATVGPVSVAIDASQFSFQLYSGGVYDERSCSSSALDHGVLAVGYGTENGKDYWVVKNSWGEEWGEQGYIKMARNSKNQCGIATQASYPKV